MSPLTSGNLIKTGRNPAWTRDELILLLDLYFRVNPLHTDKENAEITQLSELLNLLPIHDRNLTNSKFRNPPGVYMELCNFLRLDPGYSGSGLKRGSKLQEEIWNEFAQDRVRLHRIGDAIRRSYKNLIPSGSAESDEAEDEKYPEGAILLKLHKLRERNATLVKKKKRSTLDKIGYLACEVCSFNFCEAYGKLGYGFAECHHVLPVSSLPSGYKTKLSDLAIVCANCHRMLHRGRELLSIESLRALVGDARERRRALEVI